MGVCGFSFCMRAHRKACPAVNADTATLSTGHRSGQHLREIERGRMACVCVDVFVCRLGSDYLGET